MQGVQERVGGGASQQDLVAVFARDLLHGAASGPHDLHGFKTFQPLLHLPHRIVRFLVAGVGEEDAGEFGVGGVEVAAVLQFVFDEEFVVREVLFDVLLVDALDQDDSVFLAPGASGDLEDERYRAFGGLAKQGPCHKYKCIYEGDIRH